MTVQLPGKVLVANRGEVAVRIVRACHELGLMAIVVHSTADRDSRAVRLADQACCIGEPDVRTSYLDAKNILAVAQDQGADAVHPGYGFLAENASFAASVREAGLLFVGPSAECIRAMGDKINSRQAMRDAGVPVIPGCESQEFDRKSLAAAAEEIGYPVMLKATAGGGGKGIRLVHGPDELWSAYERAVGESEKAFGDGTVYVEKALEGAHHIEFQIFGDSHGEVVHLYERECSVQRRHQKVVEETPSPFMTDDLQEAMAAAAVRAGSAIGYDNAGTVEFLVDSQRNFYFLEMNTRLQVEHPVTEMVCGVDIVKEQIRVAAGEPLSWKQADLSRNGHAIEVRICAEDPENDYLPATGTIDALTLPAGPGVRMDSGLYRGLEVTLHYDPMLAKLIAWGSDRNEAIARLRQALSEFKVAGVKTNAAFLGAIIRDDGFVRGEYDTTFLEDFTKQAMPPQLFRAAMVGAVLRRLSRSAARVPKSGTSAIPDRWKMFGRSRGVKRR